MRETAQRQPLRAPVSRGVAGRQAESPTAASQSSWGIPLSASSVARTPFGTTLIGGSYGTFRVGWQHPALWRLSCVNGGELPRFRFGADIRGAGLYTSQVFGLNSSGWAVGESFLYRPGNTYDINAVVPPRFAGRVGEPDAINSGGEIIDSADVLKPDTCPDPVGPCIAVRLGVRLPKQGQLQNRGKREGRFLWESWANPTRSRS